MNNNHLKYVPKRRLKFEYRSGDGPMSLIFDGGEANGKKFSNTLGKVVVGSTLPACYGAFMTFGM